jgi:site-specific DNA recombinase
MEKAAIYTRISKDPHGEGLGVGRQEEDCRALCERNGWTPIVYCDNDRSAWDSRKIRPAFTAMIEAVRAGEINIIVAWHPDRLLRQTRELVSFIDLVNGRPGIEVQTVTAGKYDLTTPSGRFNARMLGAYMEFESDHKSARIRRKLQANAATGRHHGGMRPYGYNDDRVTLRRDEAAVVVEATKRILAGEAIKSIMRDFNRRGLRTATGREWQDITVRQVVLRPRNAAKSVHHGVIVGDGAWEPILSLEDFYSVTALLNNPVRRTSPGRGGKVHLLSGIARCGVCGDVVGVGQGKRYKGVSRSTYRCRSKSCVSRDKDTLDDLVTRWVLGRLASSDAAMLLLDDDNDARSAVRQVEELNQRLADAAQAYAAGAITIAQMTMVTAAMEPQLEMAQQRASTPFRAHLLDGLVGAADVEKEWESIDPVRRRAIVRLLVNVKIHPTHRGPGFNSRDVEITLRSSS